MSVEAILAAIEASGEAEAAQLRAEAHERIAQTLAEAEHSAEARRQEAMRQALLPAAAERARRLHRANLEALCLVGEARDRLIEDALNQARSCLIRIRAYRNYALIMRRLTEEALDSLGDDSGPRQMQIDPRDEAMMRGILGDIQHKTAVSLSLNCWGGLTACSGDGRIAVINTVEARLERALPFLRQELAAVFENGQSCPTSTMAMLGCEQ